ncbi:MAG: hypothetical protein ABEJ89_08390 [Haloarculaceae archaeon]
MTERTTTVPSHVRARALVHPDSNIDVEGVDVLSIQGMAVISRSENSVTVDVSLEGDRALHVILHRYEGEWLIYGSE